MINAFNPDCVLQVLQSVLPKHIQSFGLHEPCFVGNEWSYVKECINMGWVSSVGTYVNRFEDGLAEYTEVKKAVAVVNGTAALQICLNLVGVKQGDEVLVPALTFVATTNAVAYCGAVPHFVDSEERTLGIDPSKLHAYLEDHVKVSSGECKNKMTGRRIKAIIPMHTFGHPVDMEPLLEICARYSLEVVEDSAESLGSFYRNRHTGTWGRVSALSFNGNKIVTTGGGGAILTNDDGLARLAKHLTTTARVPHPWQYYHDMTGYNFRLPNINAALGCAQLEQLPGFLRKKRALAARYQKAFEGIKGLRFFLEPDFAQSNYWLNTLLLDRENAEERDKILEITQRNGIATRPVWTLMHHLPMYCDCPRMDLSAAEDLQARLINIPSSAFL